jgi:hypothetical protein
MREGYIRRRAVSLTASLGREAVTGTLIPANSRLASRAVRLQGDFDMIKLFAVPLFAFALLAGPAFAEDAMAPANSMMGDSMAAADPMATECIAKAEAETDAMKMGAMMTDCGEMYPDAVMAHCMMKADMEADAMKHDEMAKACHDMAPGAMQSAM